MAVCTIRQRKLSHQILRRGEAVAAEEALDVAHLVHDRGVGDAVLVDGLILTEVQSLPLTGTYPVALQFLPSLGVDGKAILVDPVLLAAEVDELVARRITAARTRPPRSSGWAVEGAGRGHSMGAGQDGSRRRPAHRASAGLLRGDVRLPALAAQQQGVAHAVGLVVVVARTRAPR